MPRPWLERVGAYADYRAGVRYECLVVSVGKCAGGKQIKVELEHADDSQLGRAVILTFPRPIPPAGRPIEFFRACGLNIAADGEFAPKDAIGKQIFCRFDRDRDGRWHPVRFEPVTERPNHDDTH